MSDDRDQFGQDYNALTAKINSTYAKKWNYDFIYIKTEQCYSPSGYLRHPSWAKLLSTKKIIKDYNYDIIIYIDSDCIFSNQDISIEEYLKTIKNVENKPLRELPITFLNDIPWSDKLPCAGFYIVRTKDITIFDDWFNCELFPYYNTNHSWEQYILYNYILPKWGSDIEIINDVMFLEKENQFIRHIGTHESYNRVPFFEEYIKVNKM